MERMMAMHAPICTTRLLPTRVSCRHPMFSLSGRTQHSSGFEACAATFLALYGSAAFPRTSKSAPRAQFTHVRLVDTRTPFNMRSGQEAGRLTCCCGITRANEACQYAAESLQCS